MSLLVGVAVLVLLSLPLAVSIYRSNELFVLEVRKGRPRIVRGRLPQRLLDDISDVVARPRVVSGRIRVVRERGRPRVFASGQFDEGHVQRLRNVVGTYEVAKILSAPRARRR